MTESKPTKAQLKVLEAMNSGAAFVSQRRYVQKDWYLFGAFTSEVHWKTGYALLANKLVAAGSEYDVPGGGGTKMYRTPYTLTDAGRAALSRANGSRE